MKNKPVKKTNNPSFPDNLYRFPFAYILIFLLIFLVYAQDLFFSLGKLDESNIILEHIGFLTNFHNLKEALLTNPFFNRGGDFYRPLQNLSFMIDAHLSGSAGWAYYLSNILIHGITCSLLYYLLTLIGNNKRTAYLLALIFAVHPLFVQTIAWAPSRGDLFLGMFSIACFLFFIRYIRSGKIVFMFLSVVTFTLALLSKETAVILPVICLLWYLFIENEKKVRLVQLGFLFAFFLIIFAAFMYVRNDVVRIVIQKGQFGIIPFLVHLRTIPEFIFKIFLPFGLGPIPAFDPVYTLIGLVLITGLIIVAIRYRKGSRNIYLFGLSWFLLFSIPALMYINKFGSAAFDYMEHRAYVPSIGILIFLYYLISQRPSLNRSKNLPLLLVSIILIFGIYTHVYARNYKTPQSYYELAVSNNPVSAIAWFNRAATKMNFDKDYAGAIKDYNMTMKLYPDYAEAYINRGYCSEQLNDTANAISDYETAARLKPGWYEPHVDLAILKRKMGLIKEAEREYDTVLDLLPSFYQGYNERGFLRMELGDYRSALEDLNKAISMNEKYPEAFFNRGLLEFRLEDYNSAMEDYNRAIMLDKDYVEAWVNRGVLKYRLQDYQGAVGDFNQALTLDDKYAEAYLDRGMARYMSQDLKGACEDWTTAKSLQLTDADALLEKYCGK